MMVGSELVIRDVGGSLELLPTRFTFDTSTSTGSASGDDHFDLGLGLRVGGRYSFSTPGTPRALILGADLEVGDYAYGSTGNYRTYGGRLSVGYGAALDDVWAFLFEPTVEFGRADLSFSQNTAFGSVHTQGNYFGYGVRASAVFAWSRDILMTVGMGYVVHQSDLSGGGETFRLRQSGLTATIGVSYRLSTAPTLLE